MYIIRHSKNTAKNWNCLPVNSYVDNDVLLHTEAHYCRTMLYKVLTAHIEKSIVLCDTRDISRVVYLSKSIESSVDFEFITVTS